jgi:two-component system, LytTR family, sensor kinase
MTTVYLYDESDFASFLLFNLQRLPIIMAATYSINYFVVSKQLVALPTRYGRAVFLFLFIFLVATFLDRIVSGFDWIEPTLNGLPLDYRFINLMPISKNAFLLLGILGLSASIQFFQASVKQQQQIFTLKEEKLESELAFLRSQVNPHFLFNMFNNLYSLAVREGSPELAKGLSGMAGLMRYLTYECHIPRVPLTKEIDLIQSFIELQRIRISDDHEAFINFRVDGDFSDCTIAPVLLLPLVENAFKHGVAPQQAVWIDIALRREQSTMVMEIKNKKPISSNVVASGVGIKNLRKRLELIYPNSHELTIYNEPELFKIVLKISVL